VSIWKKIVILRIEIHQMIATVTASSSLRLISAVTDYCGSDDRFKLPYDVEVRPNQDFKLDNARSKLLNLRLRSYDDQIIKFLVPGDVMTEDGSDGYDGLGFNDQQGKLLYLSGLVDMENTVTIGCAGAVLTHLHRLRTSTFLPGDHAANALFRVTSMEMFSLKETMWEHLYPLLQSFNLSILSNRFINSDTLDSLQILQSESHPNAFNQGPGKSSSGSKESLSVYGLFHHLARTPQGKQKLRQLFLRPSLNIDTIEERLDFITLFLQSDNAAVVDKIVQGLKKIKNLRPVMIHLRKGINATNTKFGGIRSGVWATLLAVSSWQGKITS
jgi:DNA mismatch repair protein MSH5